MTQNSSHELAEAYNIPERRIKFSPEGDDDV